MKKLLILFIFSLAFCNNVNADKANCSAGKCEFMYSKHYEQASTHCAQTLAYEEVKTELLYFIILKTGEKCMVFDSK
jgi:hypothetical protein